MGQRENILQLLDIMDDAGCVSCTAGFEQKPH